VSGRNSTNAKSHGRSGRSVPKSETIPSANVRCKTRLASDFAGVVIPHGEGACLDLRKSPADASLAANLCDWIRSHVVARRSVASIQTWVFERLFADSSKKNFVFGQRLYYTLLKFEPFQPSIIELARSGQLNLQSIVLEDCIKHMGAFYLVS
jgi:hypothetical protein